MKIILFANTEWYLYNFRLPLACYLRDHGYEVVMVSPPGLYVTRLQDAGFRTHIIPMQRRSLNPLQEFILLNQIRRLYAQERPDFVHHFTIKCVIYGSLAAQLAGIKNRINAVTGLGHVFTSDSIKARLLRFPVKALLRLALGGKNCRLILQNPDDQALFQRTNLITPHHIRLIRGSGVDTQRFQPDSRLGSQPLKILLATRLLWEKGIAEYINAAQRLRQQGLNAQFLLAGNPDPGNPASISKDQLAKWHQEGYVNLLGHVDDMPILLKQTDIVVLPSYREGVPRSLIEAAACGLPLIATDVPGCREIVEHGVNGLLVPVKDATALAAAIYRLCNEPETRQRMGLASRIKVLNEFDEQIVFKKTLAVYEELIHSK